MTNNLLLLHGALGTKAQFKQLKTQLSDQFNIYDLDFEGHGESASEKEFTMNLFTENVIQFLKEQKIERVHIFGYSMGGYVALNLARKAPNLVERIITLGTKFDWTAATAEKEIKMLNPDKIEEKVPAFAQHLATTHAANDWKNVLRKTAQMMIGLGGGKRLTMEQLSQINHEILIGIGSKDHMVGIAESEANANALPNATLKVIDDFVHPIEKNDMEKLTSIIEGFLKN